MRSSISRKVMGRGDHCSNRRAAVNGERGRREYTCSCFVCLYLILILIYREVVFNFILIDTLIICLYYVYRNVIYVLKSHTHTHIYTIHTDITCITHITHTHTSHTSHTHTHITHTHTHTHLLHNTPTHTTHTHITYTHHTHTHTHTHTHLLRHTHNTTTYCLSRR